MITDSIYSLLCIQATILDMHKLASLIFKIIQSKFDLFSPHSKLWLSVKLSHRPCHPNHCLHYFSTYKEGKRPQRCTRAVCKDSTHPQHLDMTCLNGVLPGSNLLK